MPVQVALIALCFMCCVVPTNLAVVIRSEIKTDFNVYYMYCGEARPSLQPPSFLDYLSASEKPECQIKFASFDNTKSLQPVDEGGVVEWASLSNDNYHLYLTTVFKVHPDSDPYVSASLEVCFCTSENRPTPEDEESLLNLHGWAVISPFYQADTTIVFREDEMFSRFISQLNKQANSSLSEHVVTMSKSNEGNTSISHLFSFHHEFLETLQISELPAFLLYKKEPDSVLFEIIEDAYENDNWEYDWKKHSLVMNQTKAYNFTKLIDIPSGQKATVTHHINYTVFDVVLNETIWYAVANFTFQNTLHVLPPQHVYRLLRLQIFGDEMQTYYEGDAVLVNEIFIAKGNVTIKDDVDIDFEPIGHVETIKIAYLIIVGISGVVSLILVFGYLRFRKASKMPKNISSPLVPFGAIHVPGYSNADNDNDANINDAVDDPNVIDSAHLHYQDLLAEIFHDNNDATNNNINADPHDASNGDHNDINQDEIHSNKSKEASNNNNDTADNDRNVATNKSKSDANNCNHDNSNINDDDNAIEDNGSGNDNTNPPPSYQDVVAEINDVTRAPNLPERANRMIGIELTDSDEHIYSEIYDVPRIPSIPVRRE